MVKMKRAERRWCVLRGSHENRAEATGVKGKCVKDMRAGANMNRWERRKCVYVLETCSQPKRGNEAATGQTR